MPKYVLHTEKKKRKVGLTDYKLKCFPPEYKPPPLPPYIRSPPLSPEYRPIKCVLCLYIRPGRINGILLHFFSKYEQIGENKG